MSLRKVLIMFTLLLALGGYVYFVELPREQKEAQTKKLLTFDKENVTAVSLTYPDRSLSLKKDEAGKWHLTQPIESEADETTVTNLINALADTEVSRVLEEGIQDLALYGLDQPMVKLQVTLQDGSSPPEVSIGKDTPVGFSVYVQKAGDPKIFLTPQAFRLGMTKEVKDLRDKAIVTFETNEVKKIAIHRGGHDIVLSKNDTGWMLDKPVSSKADETQVQTFLSSVRGMRAQDFIEQPLLELQEFGLDPPQLTVSLTLGTDNAQKTILIGGERSDETGGKKLYVKRGEADTLFLVGDWVLRDVDKTANDFRDKTVVHLDREKVTKVEVWRRDGDSFTLSRGEDKKWTIDKTQEGTLREMALSQLVDDLSALRGFEIAAENPDDLSVYGLQEPVLKITAYDDSGTKLAAIIAGQKSARDKHEVFAMAEEGSTVFTLRDYVFDRVNKQVADFWEKPVDKKEDQHAGEGTASELSESDIEEGGEGHSH
jgi:hypothetical protein